jgi:hypothetical protein
VTTTRPWNQPPWYAAPARRIRFLRAITDVDNKANAIKPQRAYRGGFGLQLSIQPAGLPLRHIEVNFSPRSPDVPHVFVDGPDESPHRYPDRSLCMWYPYDPPEARWWPTDGPETLIGHVAAHLIKEEWYRRTGDWPGEEVSHASPPAKND